MFGAIADPTRRAILSLLSTGDRSITALTSHFPISRVAVSKHLAVLHRAGLVTEAKVGRERRYHLQPDPLREVHDWVSFYERFWLDKLDALGRHLQAHPDGEPGQTK